MSMKDVLLKQHYYLAGEHEHSAVKICHWTKENLLRGRICYKEKFYGIYTHRCLQMTPALNHCNQLCTFCWRVGGFSSDEISRTDDPKRILDDCIKGQKILLSGYKGDPKVSEDKWNEAINPFHVAISLSGEPTMYEKLDEFIGECHQRGLITFLVTNGTKPDVLEKLVNPPTQLYISLDAPDRELYQKLCSPRIKDGWERVMRTIDILGSLNTRTVVRTTVIKGINLDRGAEFGRLLEDKAFDFYEPKAYVCVGSSRERLTLNNMPSFEEVDCFAKDFMHEAADFRKVNEMKDSRVLLLSRGTKPEFIPETGRTEL